MDTNSVTRFNMLPIDIYREAVFAVFREPAILTFQTICHLKPILQTKIGEKFSNYNKAKNCLLFPTGGFYMKNDCSVIKAR